ncbi:hypothetical protein NFHSH190041_06700 [Shewanella sp. NFH-SH190041]|uniref:hypothetical protein n=1 Tax=Shewanella sp. NFH-SH190041 TaxID=2950245 RepID=UPI0021C2BA6B|nr:hypothetical protein [Shewanella sp. NFH-SH190041]BDM63218.1 hypothetical protein NFHSH190041_06700 [Shewanella sp. NFH-SH190041]
MLDYRLAGNNLYLEVTCQGITLQRHNMLVNLNGTQPSASLADHHLQINQQGTLTDYPLNDALLAPEPQTDMQLQHQATLYATQSKRALVVYSNCPQLRLNRAAELEGQATHRCRDFSRDIAFGLQPQFAEQPEQHTPLTQLIRYQFDNL